MIQQIKDSQRSAYEILRDDHQELLQLQIQDEDLSPIYNLVSKSAYFIDGSPTLSAKERKIYNFYVAEFDLYERIWRVKKETPEEISDAEWIAWLLYLEKISHHWIFEYAFNEHRQIFDEKVMDEIKSRVIESAQREKLLAEYQQALKSEKETEAKNEIAKIVRAARERSESELPYRLGLKRFDEYAYEQRIKKLKK